jgi:hypothetical protein
LIAGKLISSLKEIPAVQSLIRSHAWQSFRYEITLRVDRRENSTFTGFLRLPTQFEALEGPVIEYILASAATGSEHHRDRLFQRRGDLHGRVRFEKQETWSCLSDRYLCRNIGTADIVFAQNFLLHMNPPDARKAFDNVCHLLNERAAFFVDGIDLNIQRDETLGNKLIPLDYMIPQIHDEARRARGAGDSTKFTRARGVGRDGTPRSF